MIRKRDFMKRLFFTLLFLSVSGLAYAINGITPVPSTVPTSTPTLTPTATFTPSPTPTYGMTWEDFKRVSNGIGNISNAYERITGREYIRLVTTVEEGERLLADEYDRRRATKILDDVSDCDIARVEQYLTELQAIASSIEASAVP